jgi:hypothetical protein
MSESEVGRRAFVKGLALAAPALALGAAHGEDEPEPPKEKAPTEADARMQLILARFGSQLDEAARKSVRGEVESLTRRAQTLRKFALENGDGPFQVFNPYRGSAL